MSKPFTPLPDGFEPTARQVWLAVDSAWTRADSPYESIVFAGFGEPTLKLDVLLDSAKSLKSWRSTIPLRLNTNGLGAVHWKKDIIEDLKESGIESVTVALNSADPAQYKAIMEPTEEGAGLEDVCEFAAACVEKGLAVECTAVEMPEVRLADVAALAKSMGCTFRSRSYHPGAHADKSSL